MDGKQHWNAFLTENCSFRHWIVFSFISALGNGGERARERCCPLHVFLRGVSFTTEINMAANALFLLILVILILDGKQAGTHHLVIIHVHVWCKLCALIYFWPAAACSPATLLTYSIPQGACLNSIPYCFYVKIRTYVTLKRFPDLWILNVYFLDTGHDLVQSLEITELIRLFIVIRLTYAYCLPAQALPDCFQVAFKLIFQHVGLKAFQSCIKTNECVGFFNDIFDVPFTRNILNNLYVFLLKFTKQMA